MLRANWITSTSSNKPDGIHHQLRYQLAYRFLFLPLTAIPVLLPHTLKRIRRCSRFKSAAPQHFGAGSFYGSGNFQNLFFRFYRTRTCNYLKITAAQFLFANFNNRIIRMELSIGFFIRFRYTFYIFHQFIGAN